MSRAGAVVCPMCRPPRGCRISDAFITTREGAPRRTAAPRLTVEQQPKGTTHVLIPVSPPHEREARLVAPARGHPVVRHGSVSGGLEMSAVTDTIRTGVNTEQLFATLDLIKDQP